MANAKQIETSLLTEHLRYTPLTLLDDIINTVNLLATRAVDAAEAGLLDAPPEALGYDLKAKAEGYQIPKPNAPKDGDQAEGNSIYEGRTQEIEEGVHKLETLLEANIDRNFDKFEIWVLRNVLTVPGELVRWVRLGHYEGLDLESKPDQQLTPETLLALRSKLLETRKLHHALSIEKARNEALINQLRSLLTPPSQEAQPKPEHNSSSPGNPSTSTDGAFAFLTSTESAKSLGLKFPPTTTSLPHPIQEVSQPPQPQAQPLTESTTFILTQLPHLRRHLSSLRPSISSLSSLAKEGQGEAMDVDDVNAERKAYIEAQTRRALERSGVDISSAGSAEGRRVNQEEVRALEGVVGILGNERGEDADMGAERGEEMEE